MKTDFASLLRKTGLKATPARLAILEAFSQKHLPLSADDIRRALKGKEIDAVTIYRTLGSLEKGSILKRVDLRKDAAHFELAADHHHHLVCVGCGTIEDFDSCGVGGLIKKIAKDSVKFSTVSDHSFELYGTCMACTEK